MPTVHVSDLAQIIHNVIDQKPKTRYIVAVDESQTTLEEIVKAVRYVSRPHRHGMSLGYTDMKLGVECLSFSN